MISTNKIVRNEWHLVNKNEEIFSQGCTFFSTLCRPEFELFYQADAL